MLFSITNTWSDEVPEKHCLQWHLCLFLNPIIFLLKMCYYIPIFAETTTRLSTTETSATSGNLKETSFLKWTSYVNHLRSVDVVDVVAIKKESMVRIIIEDITEFSTLLSVESNPRLLWFRFTSLSDWLIEFTPPSQPITIITKSNRNLVTNLKVNWHFFSLFFFSFFASLAPTTGTTLMTSSGPTFPTTPSTPLGTVYFFRLFLCLQHLVFYLSWESYMWFSLSVITTCTHFDSGFFSKSYFFFLCQ